MDRQCTFLVMGVCLVVGLLTVGCGDTAFWQSQKTGPVSLTATDSSLLLPAEEVARLGETSELTDESSLPDYLTYAALKNPALEAAFNKWLAATERVPQVKALPDPRFTYRYFIEEVETRVGAQRQSFELAQTFPWFGKLALRGDAASEAANVAKQQFEQQKLLLFYQVADAYYELYFLGRAIAIVTENRDLLIHFESVARTRYKVGAGSHPDVIRAQVETGKLEDRLRSLQALRHPIVARLNAALNRPPAAPLPWPGEVAATPTDFTDEQLVNWLAESNPQLKALDAEIARREHRLALARKDYFPDVTLGVGYIDTNNSTGGRHPSDDGEDPIIAMVSVNLPIWRDKLAAGVREARHLRLSAVSARANRLNTLNSELSMAIFRFRDAERKINLYRDTLVPKARQSIKAMEASFRAGKGSFLDLVDAERILLEFELAYERALAHRMQRLAELEKLVGKKLPLAGNQQADPVVGN